MHTPADNDLEEADRRIAEARSSGSHTLTLSGLRISSIPEGVRFLEGLESLKLSECRALTDVQVLAGLTGLQSLDLSRCRSLTSVHGLAGLISLQSLDLSWCLALTDVEGLAGLTGLQSLDLTWCHALTDVQALAGLTGLRSLSLSWCENLTHVQVLAGLTGLRSLDLTACTALTDLLVLSGLTGLQSLNLSLWRELKDVRVLAGMTALQALNMNGCWSLTDVQGLARLTGLQSLDLSRCEELTDLQPLAGLTELRSLTLLSGAAIDCGLEAQPMNSWRDLRTMYADRLLTAPGDLASQTPDDDALPRIRAWQHDLSLGEAPNSSVKLFILGNGLAGKTQICRRLRGEPFDDTVKSTHGIELGYVQLFAGDHGAPAVDAMCWDFGGQDIYLGTHARFLDPHAIYVIAWNPALENSDEIEHAGFSTRNRPLAYWLEFVRSLAGAEAPVIVAQTQCDAERSVLDAPVPTGHGFIRLRPTSCSAKLDDGMESLRLELKKAAKYQLERHGKVRLPTSWVAVGARLTESMSQKTISREQFDELLAESNSAAPPSVVLEYMHRSGQVFWQPDVFGGRVVLDLQWALAGVYAVLDRERSIPYIRRHGGLFSIRELSALIWQDYSDHEKRLFLGIMKQCAICFQVGEDLFIAPALLPDGSAVDVLVDHIWRGATADAMVFMDYAFLHEGVMRALLCAVGHTAGFHAVYWAYGVVFYDKKSMCSVRLSASMPDAARAETRGRVSIEVAGPGAGRVAALIVTLTERLSIGRAPEVTWERGEGSKGDGEQADDREREHGLGLLAPAPPPVVVGAPLRVHVSYKRGGESEVIVDDLARQLPSHGFDLVRDRNAMSSGDRISQFMLEIGRAERVLLVLDDAYLRSDMCMRELLHIHQRSLGEIKDFAQRVTPIVVGELGFSRAHSRLGYVRYWHERHNSLEEQIGSVGVHAGNADRGELQRIRGYLSSVSDILAWVGDVLMPPVYQDRSQAIAAAITLLEKGR